MMDKQDEEIVWLFSFGLEAGEGKQISRRLAEELLEHIILWAEERELQVGGGYTAGSSLDFRTEMEGRNSQERSL